MTLSFGSYGAKILAYTRHSSEKLVIDLEKIQGEEEGKKEGSSYGAWVARELVSRRIDHFTCCVLCRVCRSRLHLHL